MLSQTEVVRRTVLDVPCMPSISLFPTYSQMIRTTGSNDPCACFEGLEGQMALLYFFGPAQCDDPFPTASLALLPSQTPLTTRTNMDLPVPDVESRVTRVAIPRLATSGYCRSPGSVPSVPCLGDCCVKTLMLSQNGVLLLATSFATN